MYISKYPKKKKYVFKVTCPLPSEKIRPLVSSLLTILCLIQVWNMFNREFGLETKSILLPPKWSKWEGSKNLQSLLSSGVI